MNASHAVILGAGHAAAQLVTSLRQQGWQGDITLVGEEPVLPYQRPPLSKAYLAGQMSAEQMLIKNAAAYEKAGLDISTLDKRIAHIMQSSFAGRRIVVFSGGEAKDEATLLTEIKALRDGGASGSIVGRNAFQRKREDALALLGKIIDIYKS